MAAMVASVASPSPSSSSTAASAAAVAVVPSITPITPTATEAVLDEKATVLTTTTADDATAPPSPTKPVQANKARCFLCKTKVSLLLSSRVLPDPVPDRSLSQSKSPTSVAVVGLDGRDVFCHDRSSLPSPSPLVEYVYCDSHRIPATHDCEFDIKKMHQENLEKNLAKLGTQKGGSSFNRI